MRFGKSGHFSIKLFAAVFGILLFLGSCDGDNGGPDPDVTAPAAVDDLTATRTAADSAQLTWTAVGDDGKTGTADAYDIRYATDPGDLADWDSANIVANAPPPQAPGTGQSVFVGGLVSNESYSFAVRVGDEESNWSGTSNVATIGPALLPPPPVDDLTASWLDDGEVLLTWNAVDHVTPGQSIDRYDIRYSMETIDVSNWNAALPIDNEPTPQSGGNGETMTVATFDPDSTYYFAMKVVDDLGTPSEISNVVEHSSIVAPPEAVADLSAEWLLDCDLRLSWSDATDDYPGERVVSYVVRVLDEMITEGNWDSATELAGIPAPLDPGTTQSMVVSKPALFGGEYYYAIKAIDEVGNESSLSNVFHISELQWTKVAERANIKIKAAIEHDGYLVVGGAFDNYIIDGVAAKHIARWDGSNWQAMGTGLGSGISGNVQALAIDVDGSLVAGGIFDRRGDGTGDLNNIARWNGSSWEAYGNGFNGKVAALAVYDGRMVAAGTFGVTGGVPVNNIARWTGTAWAALGSGLASGSSGDNAYCLAVHGNQLIAGGRFDTAGGIASQYVAAWDGSSWSSLAGIQSRVRALLSFNGELYAGNVEAPEGVYRLDGATWVSIGDANNSVFALSSYDGYLVAGGAFLEMGGATVRYVARYDNGSWTAFCPMFPDTGPAYVVDALGQYGTSLVTGQTRYVYLWDQP